MFKLTNEQQKEMQEMLNAIDFDFVDYCDLEKCDSEDDVSDMLQEKITYQDIIYYYNAIKYLTENDPSLNDSLALADEYGYTLKDLDSEKLATMLYQHNLSQNQGKAVDIIMQFWADETEEEE